ncbi:hypothetical protein EA472_09290 [Natrarchaeobius oligotrophus]|uniref:Uncharacterized protein n=1 Tax=Natrarchaeobius chitinivorans TaxID=1679083 RepID=A0A3N6MAN0_NATCH|nr:hypothetical protein EA472_09290 [Natrarchaeobius chitinivorans]
MKSILEAGSSAWPLADRRLRRNELLPAPARSIGSRRPILASWDRPETSDEPRGATSAFIPTE